MCACRECSAIELSAIANWSCTSTSSRIAIGRCSSILTFYKRIFSKVVVPVYLIEDCVSQITIKLGMYNVVYLLEIVKNMKSTILQIIKFEKCSQLPYQENVAAISVKMNCSGEFVRVLVTNILTVLPY